jgi:hypothetical protein
MLCIIVFFYNIHYFWFQTGIHDIFDSVWNSVISGIDYWRQYIKSETTDAVNDVWLDAKPIVQKFLDDVRYLVTAVEIFFLYLFELHIYKMLAGKLSYPCTGLDRPIGLQEVDAPRISWKLAHEGGKVVSPTHRPPLPPRRYLLYSFLLGTELTRGP